MSNKLTPVIIDNPCQKCWQYRTRDTLMALATLGLWLLVLSRLYGFYAVEEALLERLYSATMLQLLVAGFIVTFLLFHLWAMYNRYLYRSLARRELDDSAPLALEHQQSLQAQQFMDAQNMLMTPEREPAR